MEEHTIAEQKHYWTGVLIEAQETLAESIGQPAAYFKADAAIRQARRELRRLEKGGQVMAVYVCPTMPEAAAQAYPTAEGFRVDRRGRLIVWGAQGATVAIWAPGYWAGVQRGQ